MTDTRTLMDMAQVADREALFSALQRALITIVDMTGSAAMGHVPTMADLPAHLDYIRAGLEIGHPLGSPEQLAARR